MSQIEEVILTTDFKVIASAPVTVFSEEVEHVVNRLWQKAIQEKPALFNGKFFNYISFKENKLYGEFVEYKFYYASMIDRVLRKEMNLLPVGMTGITKCEDKILIGKRSDKVACFCGQYELIPAGSLDEPPSKVGNIDVIKQFLRELEEETGIPPVDVQKAAPILLLLDKEKRSAELFASITLKSSLKQATLKKSSEHTELRWIDKHNLQKQLEQLDCVPTTQHFFQTRPFGLI